MSCIMDDKQVKQEGLYADSGKLFGKFCEHCIDSVCVDPIKEHLKWKTHKNLSLKRNLANPEMENQTFETESQGV